jgi:hypothetical protein
MSKIQTTEPASTSDKRDSVHVEDVVACLRFKLRDEASACRACVLARSERLAVPFQEEPVSDVRELFVPVDDFNSLYVSELPQDAF